MEVDFSCREQQCLGAGQCVGSWNGDGSQRRRYGRRCCRDLHPESKTERSAATSSLLPDYAQTSVRVWFGQWTGLPGKYFFPGGPVRPFTLTNLEKINWSRFLRMCCSGTN